MSSKKTQEVVKSYYNLLREKQYKWDPTTYIVGLHKREILSLNIHPQGQYVASAGHDFRWFDHPTRKWGRVVCLWDTHKVLPFEELVTTHKSPITEFRFSSEGMNIFVASSDGFLSHWNFVTSGNIQHFKGHEKRVNSIQRDSDSRVLCSGSDDGTTRIWDVRTSRQTHTFNSNSHSPVTSVTFDSTGNRVISATKHRLDFWDVRAAAMVTQLKGHEGLITGTSVSPNGSFLLSNSQDDTLRLWDIRTYSPSCGDCLNIYRGHLHDPRNANQLLRCAWSADNYFVSAGSANGVLCVWDCQWQTPAAMINAHYQPITDVAFHPNANIVMSGSMDNRIFWQDVSKLQ